MHLLPVPVWRWQRIKYSILRRKNESAAEKQRIAPLTDEEIEAELTNYRIELLAEEKARSASEDGNAKRA